MSTKPKTAYAPTDWTEEHTGRARQIWDEYQSTHDLSERKGQIAGIDPRTGRVWLGEWIGDVVDQRDAEGIAHPLLFMRVGSPTVFRKGGRR